MNKSDKQVLPERRTEGRRPGRRRIGLLVALVVAIVFGYATCERSLPSIGGWLDIGVEPKKTDYVMLLNGDRDTRPFKVADLFIGGHAKRVLITSVRGRPDSLGPEHHEVAHDILTKCGVPAARIKLIDSDCRSTFDEATTLGTFLDQNPDITVCVVTSQYHTRRSRWVFAKVLGPKMSRVFFVSAPTDRFDATNWWKNEEGFTLYLSEFFKFGFYLVRYGSSMLWLSGLAVMVGTIVLFRRRKTQLA